MALTIETEGVGAIADPPIAGNYHVSIASVDEEGGNNGEMIVDFEVLAGSTKGMEGRNHRAYYSQTTAFAQYFHRLAVIAGLITAEDLAKKIDAKEAIEYDFTKTVGRQAMITIHEDEYNGKKNLKMSPFHIWSVEDPTCQTWPKNEKLLKKAGYKVASKKKGKDKEDEGAELGDLEL